jgi:hypothetical protein
MGDRGNGGEAVRSGRSLDAVNFPLKIEKGFPSLALILDELVNGDVDEIQFLDAIVDELAAQARQGFLKINPHIPVPLMDLPNFFSNGSRLA